MTGCDKRNENGDNANRIVNVKQGELYIPVVVFSCDDKRCTNWRLTTRMYFCVSLLN